MVKGGGTVLGEQELLELLELYMDLSEKQDEVIAQLAAVVKKQAERIRQMQSVYGFFEEGSPEDPETEKIIEQYSK